MKKVRCINKHFYNAEAFTTCPICGAQQADAVESADKTAGESAKKGIFNFFGNQNKQPHSKQNDDLPNRELRHTANGRNNPDQQNTAIEQENNESNQHQNQVPQDKATQGSSELRNQVNMVTTNAIFGVKTLPMQQIQNQSDENMVPNTVPLAMENGRNSLSPVDDGKTTSVFVGKENNDPVVGWLVCLKGINFGKSYELAARANTIGRLLGNDIVLENEAQVSRNSHAVIEYDYKKSDFYLHKSNGTSPYVNDEIVLSARKLVRFDKIEIGGCLLMFVPLCGNDFSWDNYITKE